MSGISGFHDQFFSAQQGIHIHKCLGQLLLLQEGHQGAIKAIVKVKA